MKADPAAAAALVFVTNSDDETKWGVLNMAATTYWDAFDVEVGELPSEDSQRYKLFFTRFCYADRSTHAVVSAGNAFANRSLASHLELVLIVQYRIALAFSLPDIVPGVRYRTTLKNTSDALFVFAAIGVGLAAGSNALSVALVIQHMQPNTTAIGAK